MSKAYLFIAEGFEEIEAVTIADVLRRVGIDLQMISVSGMKEVKGSHGIILSADLLFEESDFRDVDILILPGGMPGAKNLDKHEGLRARILEFHHMGHFLGAICAAPMVFGNLGILAGKRATCYPGFEKHLLNASLSGDEVVTDGQFITGSGAGVAMLFAVEVAALLAGRDKANEVARKMKVPGF